MSYSAAVLAVNVSDYQQLAFLITGCQDRTIPRIENAPELMSLSLEPGVCLTLEKVCGHSEV